MSDQETTRGSAPAPAVGGGSGASTTARARSMAEDFVDRGAPWSPKTSWSIVLVEGIVVAIVGLLFIFKPLGGTSTTLQLVGFVLLGGSLVTIFQLWRKAYRPDLELLASFRAGSGVTVGAVVIVATFLTDVTEAVTAALAVVVGIGFIVFGLAGIASSLIRREVHAPLPVASLVLDSVLGLAGLLLVFAGAAGSDTVDGLFNLQGVLLIATGLALAGYAYMLRQQAVTA